jgi:P27 family predicted phage terminase small subunit
MALRGRTPTPTAIKILEGNPGKRPLNEYEPKPEKKAPPCPKWLEKEARKEWKRLAPKLEMLGVLSELDMAAFAEYCQAYARWKEAEEYISSHGSTFETANGCIMAAPQVNIAKSYLAAMESAAKQFGLTPAARSRLIANADNGDRDDELERLLS